MTFHIGKTIAAAVLTVSLAATPALADGWGWGHHGWGGHGGWGHPHHNADWGGAVAVGVLGALAVGAVAAAAQRPAYPAYDDYGGSCYPANQPIVDAWGDVVAYRRVQVCE